MQNSVEMPACTTYDTVLSWFISSLHWSCSTSFLQLTSCCVHRRYKYTVYLSRAPLPTPSKPRRISADLTTCPGQVRMWARQCFQLILSLSVCVAFKGCFEVTRRDTLSFTTLVQQQKQGCIGLQSYRKKWGTPGTLFPMEKFCMNVCYVLRFVLKLGCTTRSSAIAGRPGDAKACQG